MHTATPLTLAAVYAFAAASKARSLEAFTRYLRPVMGRFAGLAAHATLLVECALVGICIAAAIDHVLATAAGLASAAFLISASGVYAAVLSGDGPAACHCFGGEDRREASSSSSTVAPAVVGVRSGVLTFISMWTSTGSLPVSLGIAAVVPVVLIGGLGASIVLERRRLGALDSPRVRELERQIGRLQAFDWWLDGSPRPL